MNACIRSQLLLFLTLVSTSACHSTGAGTRAREMAGAEAVESWSSDVELEHDLAVHNPAVSGDPTGKRVDFTLENKSRETLEFVFAVSAYDRNGHRLSQVRPQWTSLRLGPGASQSLRVELGSPLAESWRLHVLRPGTVRQ